MKRLAIATLVVTIAHSAHADSTSPAKAAAPTAATPAKPDEIADVESREANLESDEPRRGFTLTLATDPDIMLGGGTGRGVALSVRLGHVATRKTVITFELSLPNALHKNTGVGGMTGPLLIDTNACLFAGAQRYSGSKWVRAAGGVTALSKNARADGSDSGDPPIAGIGGLVGAGADLVRLGYPWLGVEALGLASLSRDGLKLGIAAGLNVMFP